MTTRPEYPFRLPLRYTDRKRLVVVYDIETDPGTRVKVVGEPTNGAYEWVIEKADGSVEYSDVGYGIPACALRDGLAVWWGDSINVEKLRNDAHTKTATQLRAYARSATPSPEST